MDHTIQKDWKSVGVTRLLLPLGILWLTIQEHLCIKRRSVRTRWAWYLHKLWWHIRKSMLSLLKNSLFSCHIERILPPSSSHFHGLAQNATEWKINIFPMERSLKPSVPSDLHNMTMLHLLCLKVCGLHHLPYFGLKCAWCWPSGGHCKVIDFPHLALSGSYQVHCCWGQFLGTSSG